MDDDLIGVNNSYEYNRCNRSINHVSNPLLIPEILEQLFDYFKPFISDITSNQTSLFQLRLVCNTWNEEICKQFRQKQQVILNSLDSLERYNEFYDKHPNSDLVPFHKFKLTGRKWLQLNLYDSESIMKKFLFGNCAHHIRILHLELDGWNLRDVKTFFYEIELPNLKMLTVRCPNENDLYMDIIALQSTAQTIQFKSLESLTIVNMKSLLVPLMTELVKQNNHLQSLTIKESIRDISKCVSTNVLRTICAKSCLVHLKLDYYLTNTQLNSILIQRQFNWLKSLTFGVQINIDERLLCKLLKLVGGTLENLELIFEWISSDKLNLNLIQFPNLKELKVLKLANIKCSFDFFVKFCPNLQNLSLINVEAIPTIALPFSQLTYMNSLSINYTMSNNSYRSDCIEDICYICPNLKNLSLEGRLSNSIVELIIVKLAKLVELKLTPRNVYFDDECFNGSEELENPELRSNSSCCFSYNAKDEEIFEDDDEKLQKSCICQLKDLRYLHIELNTRITDAIASSISHCHQLKRLTLKGPRLTDSLLLALATKLRNTLTHLILHGGHIGRYARKEIDEILADPSTSLKFCELKEIEVENSMQLFESIVNTFDRGHVLPITNCSIV